MKLLTLKTVFPGAVTLAQRGMLSANSKLHIVCSTFFIRIRSAWPHRWCLKLTQLSPIQRSGLAVFLLQAQYVRRKRDGKVWVFFEPCTSIWPGWLSLGILKFYFFSEALLGEENVSIHHVQMGSQLCCSGLKNSEKTTSIKDSCSFNKKGNGLQLLMAGGLWSWPAMWPCGHWHMVLPRIIKSLVCQGLFLCKCCFGGGEFCNRF